jgi:hypothetical protein
MRGCSVKATKPLQRRTPLKRTGSGLNSGQKVHPGCARATAAKPTARLGRVPAMGRADGASKAIDALAFPKRKPVKRTRAGMTPLRKSAQGEGCTIQKVGVCNNDPSTVVLVHLRWLGDCGASIKPTDLQAVHGCSECNRWTDSPTPAETADRAAYEAERNFYCLRALVRTQLRMVAKGLITVKGMAA